MDRLKVINGLLKAYRRSETVYIHAESIGMNLEFINDLQGDITESLSGLLPEATEWASDYLDFFSAPQLVEIEKLSNAMQLKSLSVPVQKGSRDIRRAKLTLIDGKEKFMKREPLQNEYGANQQN